jgi:ABC-type multidrug transport system fused ATPase/permease subunit
MSTDKGWRLWTTTFGRYLQLFRFAGLLRRYRWLVVLLVAAKTANTTVGMAAPLVMRFLIDDVLTHSQWTWFAWTCVMLGSLLTVSLALALFTSFTSTRLEQKIGFDLKRTLQGKWERLPLAYFQKWGVGEHIYRCTTDVQNVTNGLTKVLPELFVAHVQFVLFLVIAANLHPRLTLWFLASLPVLLTIGLFHSRALRPVQLEAQALSSQINNSIGQYAASVVTTKVFLREKFASRRYVSELSRMVRLVFRRWGIDTRYQALGWLAGTVWGWAVILYGFTLVMRGELTLGTLIALKLYLTSLAKPIQEFGGLIQAIVLGSVSAERVHETLSSPEESTSGSTGPGVAVLWAREPAPCLRFDAVEFGYQPGSPVLRQVSASLPGTGLVGITGPSGAGKTTLVALIARLYEPSAGVISLNGHELAATSAREVRSQLSIVPQETYLFAGTVEENIAFGDGRASHDRVVHAARLAEAHEFISNLRNGYATAISASGSGLSLGQRQRIGLARALLKDSPVLILDEGLNSIDELVRARILDTLARLAERKAVLVVTHDLAALERCDRVLVVIDGGVVDAAQRDASRAPGGFMDYLTLKTQYERATVVRG